MYFCTKGAVHRYYESRRRLFNDSCPSRIPIVSAVKERTRKNERRKKLYTKRKAVLKGEKEEKLWESINYMYMTEESDEEGTIKRRSLPWRSRKLNRLIKKLNSRLKNPQMSDYLEDSSIPPPSHLKCPEWAVASSAVINDRTSSPSSSVASTSPNNSTTDPLLTQPPDLELPRNEFPNDSIHEDSLSDTDDSDYYNE